MIGGTEVRANEMAATFAALGDPRRIAIIERLYEEEALSVSSLCEGMSVSRQAVSKHLKTLADARLISVQKSGREMHYSLEISRFEEANAFLVQVGAKWDHALERLKTHVE